MKIREAMVRILTCARDKESETLDGIFQNWARVGDHSTNGVGERWWQQIDRLDVTMGYTVLLAV